MRWNGHTRMRTIAFLLAWAAVIAFAVYREQEDVAFFAVLFLLLDKMDVLLFSGRRSFASWFPEPVTLWLVRRIDYDERKPLLERAWDTISSMWRTGWHFIKTIALGLLVWRLTDSWESALTIAAIYGVGHQAWYGGVLKIERV
ncbi:MAG: hypothetical protein RhofKO_25970 [Rhodothermales bacterium]